MNSDYQKTYQQLTEEFIDTPIEKPDFFHKRTLFGYLPIKEFNKLIEEATKRAATKDTDERIHPISLFLPSPPAHIATAYHLWRYSEPRAYRIDMKKAEMFEEPVKLWRVSTGHIGDITYLANKTLIDRAIGFAREAWPLEQAPNKNITLTKKPTIKTLEELATMPEQTTRAYPPLLPQYISPADKVNERLASKSQRGMATRITRRIERHPEQQL